MANAFKMFDPTTNTVFAFDCITGAPLTAEQLAAATDCLPPHVDKEEVCVQPVGNTDPAAIVSGWSVSVISIDAVTLAPTVESTTLWDETLATDLSATHEIVKCPKDLIPVGTVCYEAA